MAPYYLRTYIRYAEIAVISVLAVFGVITYRELSQLRKVPVALPNYEFVVTQEPGKGPVVNTRGTWIAQRGPPEPLQTTTIECRKSSMQCVESAAMVSFVSEKGFLEAVQTVFEVERWGEAEVVTKAAPGKCSSRSLVLDLTNKRATSKVSASEEAGTCKGRPESTLELVTGFKVRADALKRE